MVITIYSIFWWCYINVLFDDFDSMLVSSLKFSAVAWVWKRSNKSHQSMAKQAVLLCFGPWSWVHGQDIMDRDHPRIDFRTYLVCNIYFPLFEIETLTCYADDMFPVVFGKDNKLTDNDVYNISNIIILHVLSPLSLIMNTSFIW